MNARKNLSVIYVIVAFCTIFALGGCSDSDPVAPGIEPEIINGVQSFEFQVSAVQNYTGTLSYTWNNAGSFAAVDHSSAVSGGSAMLTIMDATGAVVYSRSLSEDGSMATATGEAGDWVLTVTLSGTSGDLNFRAEEGT